MTPIDLNTCTATEIIQRSITCHPSLFRESLESQARMHNQYAAGTEHKGARRGALASAKACCDAMYAPDAEGIKLLGTGPLVVALNVACKLQCIPNHVRTASLDR